jgi:hypothetical protein
LGCWIGQADLLAREAEERLYVLCAELNALLGVGDLRVGRPKIAVRVHHDFVGAEGDQCRSTERRVWNQDRKLFHALSDQRDNPPCDGAVASIAHHEQVQVFDITR